MNLVEAKNELRKARDDAMWLWLVAKRDIMSEVMVDETNPEWARKEARNSYRIICDKLERIGRKMDKDADDTFIGDASDTPDTRPASPKYYRWDPIRMINVEEDN